MSDISTDLNEDLYMAVGPYWALLAVEGADDNGFDVAVHIGPGLTIQAVRNLLFQTLKSIDETIEADGEDLNVEAVVTSE